MMQRSALFISHYSGRNGAPLVLLGLLQWLRANTPPQTWTAVKGAGAIAYYSQRPILDAYGLNDLHIAHLPVATMGEARRIIEHSFPTERFEPVAADRWAAHYRRFLDYVEFTCA